VLNADDPRVAAMASRTQAQVMTFGTAASADLRVSEVGIDDEGRTTLSLTWRGSRADVTLRYVGEHHASNAAAAVAVALGAGLEFDVAVESLRTAAPRSKWRMEVSTNPDGVLVINDAYNANPDSMHAALQALVAIAGRRGRGRVVAVLGDMRELGEASEAEHADLGAYVASLEIDTLVAVGETTRPLFEAARAAADWAGEAHLAADPAAALTLLRGALREGDVVLVKASRAAALEGLAVALAEGTALGAEGEGGT
jgi:UDP-N-acetylmuramoyl-tripeptide--D-alanyl-D-alanine ligase